MRTIGRLASPKDFDSNRGGEPRTRMSSSCGDIATVIDGQEELRSAAFLNGTSAVTLVVSKQSGQNTVTVASAVKTRLAELAPTLPPDIKTHLVGDQSEFIEAAVRSLEHHLVLGSILASVVIFFFLANIRTTIIAAVAIPVSIVSTFFLMRVMGYTLNQITMLALTLMVGVVIDDAIIVLENIYRFIEEKGMRPFEAAIEGTKEIGLAVMATTLSLMAVFVPVGFMGGIVGRFMSSFGLTAAFAIAVSLLVSFTLTPMLCSRFISTPRGRRQGRPPYLARLALVRSDRSRLHGHAPLVDGAPRHDRPDLRPGDRQHRALVHGDRQELRAGGRPVGVSGGRPHAGGLRAARHGHRAGARGGRAARLP